MSLAPLLPLLWPHGRSLLSLTLFATNPSLVPVLSSAHMSGSWSCPFVGPVRSFHLKVLVVYLPLLRGYGCTPVVYFVNLNFPDISKPRFEITISSGQVVLKVVWVVVFFVNGERRFEVCCRWCRGSHGLKATGCLITADKCKRWVRSSDTVWPLIVGVR